MLERTTITIIIDLIQMSVALCYAQHAEENTVKHLFSLHLNFAFLKCRKFTAF